MSEPDRLRRVAGEVLDVEPQALHDDSSPQSVEGWDSLAHLQLVMAIEEEFGVSLSGQDVLELRSIGRIRAALGDLGIGV